MAPDERRAALVDATLPLLTEYGRAVPTRLIAEAAGVAEGTIFRVFDSKEELVDAALAKAFEPGQMIDDVLAIDPALPLHDRAVALVTLLQNRFRDMFALMHAVGMVGPPDRHRAEHMGRIKESFAAMASVFEPDQAELMVPAGQVVQLLRLLTFSGSHPKFSNGEVLTPAEIVDTVLYGVVRRPSEETA
jgi:AcrR family transcriptional regulator